MTDYTAIVEANNAAAAAEAGGGGGDAADESDLLAFLGMSADVVDTSPRQGNGIGAVIAAGTLYLTYFTPLVTKTVSQITMQTATATTSSGLTLARMALYTAAANGDVTLVARTASDTSLFDTLNEAETRPFATAGGFPATYDLVAGTRYAAGVLQVGTTAGRLTGPLLGLGSAALSPFIAAIKAGQTDISGNVSSVAGIATSSPWARFS